MEHGDSDLEHLLHHKLSLMTNAVAQISNAKLQLKDCADKTRKEISACFDDQILCFRSREEELIKDLQKIVTEKEQKLSEDQEKLNQTIDAFEQCLKCVMRYNTNCLDKSVDSKLRNMLPESLSVSELGTKENYKLLFQFDPSDLHQDIEKFGSITSIDQPNQSEDAASGNVSLKGCSEHVEKFVVPCYSVFSAKQMPMIDSINSWLSQGKPFSSDDDDEDDDDFEFVQEKIPFTLSTSIEVISDKENTASSLTNDQFRGVFNEINNQSVSNWLKGDIIKNVADPKINLPNLSKLVQEMGLNSYIKPCDSGDYKVNKRKRAANSKATDIQPLMRDFTEEDGYEFGKVIKSIQASANFDWLFENGQNFSIDDSCKQDSVLSGTISNCLMNGSVTDAKDFGESSKKKRCLSYMVDSGQQLHSQFQQDSNLWLLASKRILDGSIVKEINDYSVLESVLRWLKILEKVHAANKQKNWLLTPSHENADLASC